jgi:hypothetical protein
VFPYAPDVGPELFHCKTESRPESELDSFVDS